MHISKNSKNSKGMIKESPFIMSPQKVQGFKTGPKGHSKKSTTID